MKDNTEAGIELQTTKETKVDAGTTVAPMGDPQRMTPRKVALLIEMLLLCLAVMYIEICLVPALPQIRSDFQSQKSWVPWVLSAYNIIGAVSTAISGSLSNIFGNKKILLIVLSLYMIGQIGCALSSSGIFILIAFRAVQGFGMAVFNLGFTVVKSELPGKIIPMAMALLSTMFSVGMSVGLLGGAATLSSLNWYTMFWITLPVVFLVVLAFGFTMPGQILCLCRPPKSPKGLEEGPSIPTTLPPSSPAPAWTPDTAVEPVSVPTPSPKVESPSRMEILKRLDLPGIVLLAIGVISLLASLTLSETRGWKDALVLTLVIVGPVLLVIFFFWELWVKVPLVPIRLMLRRDFLILSLTTFLFGMVLFSVFQVFPFLYTSPLEEFKYTKVIYVGLLLFPFGFAQLFSNTLATAISPVMGWPLLASLSTLVATFVLGLHIRFHHTALQEVFINTLLGVAVGLNITSTTNIISEKCTPEIFAPINGTLQLLRVIGGSIGPIIANLILGSDTTPTGDYTEKAYKNTFIFLAVIAGITILPTMGISGQFDALKKVYRGEPLTRGKPAAGHQYRRLP